MSDEQNLVDHYSQKVKELNELLDTGMLSPSEYEELVGDFKDIESIREDISDEKNKILAAKIVEAISVLIKVV